MQFQAGNKFWLARSSHGRNPIFSNPEQLRNACYEDVGEIADCDFYNVSQDAKKELQELILAWAKRHVKLPYWKVQNVVKKVVTQEDLE